MKRMNNLGCIISKLVASLGVLCSRLGAVICYEEYSLSL